VRALGFSLAAGRLNDAFRVEWLVELGPDDTLAEIQPVLDRHDVSAEQAFPSVTLSEDEDLAQVYILRGSAWSVWRASRVLATDTENLDHLERNRVLDLLDPVSGSPAVSDPDEDGRILENDPLVNAQWGLHAIRGHQAHALLASLSPERRAVVAVLDTGVDGAHEDLAGSFSTSPAFTDEHGHGSHVAGLVGAVTNNGIGMASLNWEGKFIEVVGYQALEANGTGSLELIAQAIVDATEDGVDVISMSLGAKVPAIPKVVADAVSWALRSGIIVVASAGNANEDARTHFPSNIDGVIVVTAVDEQLRKAAFSNTTPAMAMPITAPGVNMLSLKSNGGYVNMSGTSMSTPVVSGMIGILRALKPDLSSAEAWTLLHSTGRDVVDTPMIGRLFDAEQALLELVGTHP
jgi:thermitase